MQLTQTLLDSFKKDETYKTCGSQDLVPVFPVSLRFTQHDPICIFQGSYVGAKHETKWFGDHVISMTKTPENERDGLGPQWQFYFGAQQNSTPLNAYLARSALRALLLEIVDIPHGKLVNISICGVQIPVVVREKKSYELLIAALRTFH